MVMKHKISNIKNKDEDVSNRYKGCDLHNRYQFFQIYLLIDKCFLQKIWCYILAYIIYAVAICNIFFCIVITFLGDRVLEKRNDSY